MSLRCLKGLPGLRRLGVAGSCSLPRLPELTELTLDLTRAGAEEGTRALQCIPRVEDRVTGLPLVRAAYGDHRRVAWGNVAVHFHQDGDDASAELAAREGLLRCPRDANLWACLIDPLRRSGRLQESVEAAQTALEELEQPIEELLHNSQSTDRACLLDCVTTLLRAGKVAEAISGIEAVAARVSPSAKITAVQSMAYASLGQMEAARACLPALATPSGPTRVGGPPSPRPSSRSPMTIKLAPSHFCARPRPRSSQSGTRWRPTGCSSP